ncbi:winged helix-turn-helix domain-containing protein [Kitasatospora sp. NPDC058397]|uniref:winged helix-turn-helix domain-containing protein n=1 Tax=unclassified Kitasatospora TaxID=2633591 RepID=UPI00364A26FF
MSSSSTATLPLPSATPHLRAVRSVPGVAPVGSGVSGAPGSSASPLSHGSPAAERWPGGAVRPSHAIPPRPAGAGVVPQPGAVLPAAPAALLAALPEGATVVAALPQGALPQGLLAQYGTQFGAGTGNPMVGYLVLVPADSPVAAVPAGAPLGGPSGVQHVGAHAGVHVSVPAQAGVRPVRPAGRGIAVDAERRNAYVDGRLLDLTYLEFELLAHLTEHPQRVHTRDHLVSAVWGYGHVGDGRTVDVHVARLRRKLGPGYRDTIVTVRRVGYKYTPAS